jgi:hypothetical protein
LANVIDDVRGLGAHARGDVQCGGFIALGRCSGELVRVEKSM